MNFTKVALTKTQVTLFTIAILCIAGLVGYFSMSRAENPLYTVRVAQIVTYWPGASPERVELLVTDKIEKMIQEISEVDYIESESKTGVSVITVTVLDQYKNMRPIWDELRRKVEDAERVLPETAKKPIVNDEYGDIFGIVFAITWDGFSYADVKEVADDLRDELLELKDVAKVDILGAQDERVFIDYNSDKLKEVSLSVEQLEQTLRERNIVQSGGIIHGFMQRIALEPTGNYTDIEDIRNTLIQIPHTDKIVTLQDIAEVYRGYIDPPNSLMRTAGFPSLGLAVSMRNGGNILKLGEEVTTLLDRYQETYPIGIEFEMVAYQPERVTLKIQEFIINLMEAVIIVCAVMLLFLGLRTGFVVASLIPVVILITFVMMSTFDIGLNQITLASLIIALGMLVDNAIVMSESIIVQVKSGKKPFDAAIASAKELKIPLLISSLTTCAAFLPFYLAESGTGEYIGSLFLVVSITLLGSWVISLTMIPIFCVFTLSRENKKPTYPGKIKRFILIKLRRVLHSRVFLFFKHFKKKKPEIPKEPYDTKIYRGYRALLTKMLKYRLATIFTIIGVFVLAIFGMKLVPKTFYPPSNTPMFTADIELPVDSSIKRTQAAIEHLEKYIEENLLVENTKKKDGIVTWASFIGNGGPRYRLQHDPEPANPYYAFMLFTATSYKAMPKIMEKLDKYSYENFPDMKATFKALQEGTPVDNPIEIRISGKDNKVIFDIVDKVKRKLATLNGTKNIDDDWGMKGKKIVVDVDQARAKRAGLTNADIAKSLESAISGVALTEYREDDELIPMVLRSEVAKNLDLIGTEAFNVYSQSTGVSVPLEQVANVYVEWEPSIIFRRNRLDTVTVFSDLEKGFTPTNIDQKIMPWLKEEEKTWPLGTRFALGGENEEAGKAQSSIFVKLPIAFMLIFFLLMAQFNCIKKTLIILMTIPLSFIGVVLGMLITQSYFGIMTILGMISLAGIVINNAIVLLDRIKIEITQNNLTPDQAVVHAAQKRMRPILLTAITTISSLLPLWLGGGPLWEPMAIALIFGLMVATILTLGIVPVLYSLLFSVQFENYAYTNLKIENDREKS